MRISLGNVCLVLVMCVHCTMDHFITPFTQRFFSLLLLASKHRPRWQFQSLFSYASFRSCRRTPAYTHYIKNNNKKQSTFVYKKNLSEKSNDSLGTILRMRSGFSHRKYVPICVHCTGKLNSAQAHSGTNWLTLERVFILNSSVLIIV